LRYRLSNIRVTCLPFSLQQGKLPLPFAPFVPTLQSGCEISGYY
jgi:hypothetical protein